MSSVFSALESSRNGMDVYQTWLDAIADNIANVNTVRRTDEEAFAARYVVAEAIDYGDAAAAGIGNGARVNRVEFGDTTGRLVHDPDHPFADEAGYVRMPNIDMNEQMTAMIMAQRGYQANVSVVERARNIYQAALKDRSLMAINAINAAGAAMRSLAVDLPTLPGVDTTQPTGPAAAAAGGNGFGDKIVGALDDLNQLHGTADSLAIQAATGDLSDVHEYTIAASQAEIATQLTVAVRDKAVSAFNEIMRMQF